MDQLHKLFIKGAYADIVRESERVCREEPGNNKAKYCAAIGFILLGKPLQGGALLAVMLQEVLGSIGNMVENEQRFWARCALQLASIGELYYHKCRNKFGPDEKAEIVGLVFVGIRISSMLRGLLNDLEQSEIDRIHACFMAKTPGDQAFSPTSLLRPHSPLIFQIEPTNHCNMNCSMCPRQIMTRDRGFLSADDLKQAMKTWDNANRDLQLIHLVHDVIMPFSFQGIVKLFFMGEPLLHPEIDRFVEIIKERGAHVGIQTNGLLLAREDVRQKMLKVCPNSIAISIEGVGEDSYDKIRKKGGLEKVFHGIREFHAERQAMGLQNDIKIVVSSIVPDADPAVKAAITSFVAPIRDKIDIHTFIDLNCRYSPEFFSSTGELVRYDAPELDETGKVCMKQMQRLNMLWDGRIIPCCVDFDGSLVLGNIADGVDATWNSQKTRKLATDLLHIRFDDYPVCRKCLTG